ncbi:uncharacterized protein LOC121994192 [Zingiber officinale]|uniref:Uncharacterized protein n=1 Tax=Zingiber officinale TaxID=94328 RepID=A0A8J5L471_ZINOF|nr:uncharacterized protein LOC121994192 [Zingiber officinale]KAG6500366.1 hypothetical protein ZIOFF_040211 [Zingiber officinale]
MACASSALTVPCSTHCLFRFRARRFAVCARKNHDDGKRSDGSHHYGGRLVDENMVTLRRRIHERRMEENGSDGVNEAPTDWMEWERRYYKRYGSDVSEVVGMVQVLLMNARPGAGLAAMAVVGLSLPAAMALLLLSLLAMH